MTFVAYKVSVFKKIWLKKDTLWLVGVLIITLLSFQSAFHADFLNWDDTYYVVKNDLVKEQSVKKLKEIVHPTTFVMGNYHPITMLSYWIDEALGGTSKTYHLINLLLHLCNTVMLYILLKRLKLAHFIVFFTLILFAIHPTRTETVMWISDRKDLLVAFFMLLASIHFLVFQTSQKKRFYALSFLWFTLACFSKIIAISLIGFAIIYYLFFIKPFRWKNIVLLLPFLAIALLSVYINITAQQSNTSNNAEQLSMMWSLQTPLSAMGKYMVNFFCPLQLAPFYPFKSHVLYGIAFLFFTLLALFFFRAKTVKLSILSFILFTLPILQIIKVGDALAADRYMYIAYIGLCIAIGHFLYQWFPKKEVQIGMLLSISFLSIGTFNYASKWINSETLWSHQIMRYPNHYLGYINRGVHYRKNQHYILAEVDFEAAWKLDKHKQAYLNKSLIYEDQNKTDKAIVVLNTLLSVYPNYDVALNNKALLLKQKGRIQEALMLLNKCLDVSPNYAEAYINRANLYPFFKSYDKMEKDAKQALEINPNIVEGYNAWGNALAYQGKLKEAKEVYQKGLAFNPHHKSILDNLLRIESIIKKEAQTN